MNDRAGQTFGTLAQGRCGRAVLAPAVAQLEVTPINQAASAG
jgi:hypothetical protein